MTIRKLFFRFMGDDCARQLLTVSHNKLTDNFDTKFASGGCRLTNEHWQTINAAFTLFNDRNNEAVYKVEFDGGITDGIEAAALHADLLQ